MNLNLTILGQAISFALFVLFCMKFVWPPITAALADRKKRIVDGLEAARQADVRLQEAEAAYRQQLVQVKKEASALIDKARHQADHILAESRKKAEQEASNIKDNAYQEVQQHVEKIKIELRKNIGELVAAGVTQLTTEKPDMKLHQTYINQLAAKL